MPALLFSFNLRAATPAEAGHAPAFARAAYSESVIARWHDYARASITPQFSWAAVPARRAPPSVLERYDEENRAEAFAGMAKSAATRIDLDVATGLVADTPSLYAGHTAAAIGIPQSGLERTVVTPSLVHRWGDSGVTRLSAVLAYQRFASLDLGTLRAQDFSLPPTWAGSGNTSYGAGARVDMSGPLAEHARWSVSYQSRVGMDAFSSYRGAYSDPGDFDIPANMSVGLSYALAPSFAVDFDAQRVMYSAITPFTSSALPRRFLALLGSGSSPNFRWGDLTVYSVGWNVHDDVIGELELRYTTRQQPLPTSALLAQALEPDTADHTVSLGWSRDVGRRSNFSFEASYASSPYLLLMPAYRASGSADASRLEFDALWSTRF